jgi:hypothetical protein
MQCATLSRHRSQTIPKHMPARLSRDTSPRDSVNASDAPSRRRRFQSIASPFFTFLTWLLMKCLVRQPGIEYSNVRSSMRSPGFPKHKKHILGLLSVRTERIARLSMASESDGPGSSTLTSLDRSLSGRNPGRLRRRDLPSSTPQYAVTALIAIILR